MALYGMDIESVRSLATALSRAADTLAMAADHLDSALGRTPWTGPDAASFRSEWNGTHHASLRQTGASLRQVSTLLVRQANEQQTASQADGGVTIDGSAVGNIGSSRSFGGTVATGTGKAVGGDIFTGLAPLPSTLTGLVPGLHDAIGDAADLLMGVPILKDAISSTLGFQYVEGQDFYTTNQTSVQSHLGFMDEFDKLGFAGGMNLDDSVSEFEYGGQEYRLELWKGNYGAGAAFGGEVGLYIRDPEKEAWESPGQLVDGFYPAADPSERIRMSQEIYNLDTGETYFVSDGHQTGIGDQYWNAAIRTDPGVEKSDLGQRGTLYVDDPGLRDAMRDALQDQGVMVTVDDAAGTVSYDWK